MAPRRTTRIPSRKKLHDLNAKALFREKARFPVTGFFVSTSSILGSASMRMEQPGAGDVLINGDTAFADCRPV